VPRKKKNERIQGGGAYSYPDPKLEKRPERIRLEAHPENPPLGEGVTELETTPRKSKATRRSRSPLLKVLGVFGLCKKRPTTQPPNCGTCYGGGRVHLLKKNTEWSLLYGRPSILLEEMEKDTNLRARKKKGLALEPMVTEEGASSNVACLASRKTRYRLAQREKDRGYVEKKRNESCLVERKAKMKRVGLESISSNVGVIWRKVKKKNGIKRKSRKGVIGGTSGKLWCGAGKLLGGCQVTANRNC